MSVNVPASIVRLAAEWGIPLLPGVADSIGGFFSDLLRWNARVNLTGAASLDELVGEHLPDSFAVVKLCPLGARVLDVGSGGGLPAVPFALARPDCAVTLVEPRAKRVAFLRSALQPRLGSRLRVWRGRAEELEEGPYEVAFSRATFSPGEWLGLAGRLVGKGGHAVVFTARPLEEGVAGADLRDSCHYSTASRAPRWAGLYRFT